MEIHTASAPFFQALEAQQTYTENGALSNAIVDPSGGYEGRLGFFYKAMRGVDLAIFDEYLSRAFNENMADAAVLAYYLRDCRGGKGERELGRRAINHIFHAFDSMQNTYAIIVDAERLLKLIAEYGRWDDLVVLSATISNPNNIYELIWDQLRKDVVAMTANESTVSLCAKWLPSEKHALDKKTGFVKAFTEYVGISTKTYRTKFLTPLRQYIDIVERRICSGEWENIDYNRVPSCAMHKLRSAFQKHDSVRFGEWAKGLATGATKINAGQLFPHQVVYNATTNRDATQAAVLEGQWAELVKKYSATNLFDRTLVVCDVSGSMSCGNDANSPINVCIGLGLMVSELVKKPWRNHIITFSANPEYVNFSQCKSLAEKINKLSRAKWDMNTDLQKVFDLILATATKSKLSAIDMPQRIIIISDMQFDQACGRNNKSNYDVVCEKYKNAGYELPQIVFWNVNGAYSDFPITINDQGVLISGFSPSVLKYIYEGRIITPLDILQEVLNDRRYGPVRQTFFTRA